MAQTMTPEELRRLVLEIQRIANKLGKDISQFQFSGDLVSQAGTILSTFRDLNRELNAINDSFFGIRENIQSSLNVLTNDLGAISYLRTLKSLGTVLNKLVADEEDWATMSKTQLQTSLAKVKVLQKEANLYESTLLTNLKDSKGLTQDILEDRDQLSEYIRNTVSLTRQEVEVLTMLKEAEEDYFDTTIDKIEERIKVESKLQSAMGITGALLDNINKIGARLFGGIGLNLSVLDEGLNKARDSIKGLSKAFAEKNYGQALIAGFKGSKEEFEKLANSLEEGGSRLDRFVIRVKTMKAGFAGIKQATTEAITDPLTMLVSILKLGSDEFNRIDKASTDVSRITGQTATAAAIYNTNLATTTQYLEKIVKLTQKLGFNAQNVFTEEVLGKAAELQNLLGLSAEEAGNLALQSQINGRSVDSNVDAAVRQVSEFNKANRSAVSQGVVLRDVMKAADGVTASLGAGTKEIAAAAAAARRLGLELGQLDQIANSLLDFESSIEAELIAQLMTGRDINLSRARELALANDLAGVGKELFENSATLAEFGQMNRIAQEEYARALGMTRDQLARTAYLRALEIGMTEEQAAAAANVSAEEMKRLSVQESIAISLQKIQEALVGPANLLAEIVSNSSLFYTILGGIAVISIAKLVTSFIALKASIAAAGGWAMILKATLLGVAGVALVALAVAGITALFGQAESKVNSIKDGIIDKDGGLKYSGPKGSIKMAPDDSGLITPDGKIIAGTEIQSSLLGTRKNTQTSTQQLSSLANTTIKVENNNTELISLLKQVVANTEKTATHTKNPTVLDPGKLILSQQMYQTTV